MGKSLVKKHNNLIKSKFNLKLNEQRLILMAISKIKRGDINKINGERTKYIIDLKDIDKDLMSVNQSRIRKYCLDIRKHTFIVEDIENKKNFYSCSWFDYVKYLGNTQQIEVRFDEIITPFLFQLKKENGGNFSSYFLDYVSKFKSSYSIRIYELLMIVKNTSHKSLKLKLDYLFDILIIKPSMQKIVNFRREVLDRVVEDINEHSDIFITYQFIKNGRSFTHIKFNFKMNNTFEKNYYSELLGLERRLKEVLSADYEYYGNEYYVDNIIEEYISKIFFEKSFLLNINGLDKYILKDFEKVEDRHKDGLIYDNNEVVLEDNRTTKHLKYILYVERFDYYEERLHKLENLLNEDYCGDDYYTSEDKENEFVFECELNDSRELYYFLNKYLIDTNI